MKSRLTTEELACARRCANDPAFHGFNSHAVLDLLDEIDALREERDQARLGVVNLQQACELMRRERDELLVQLGSHRDLPEQVRNLFERLQAAGVDAQRVQIGDHR